MVDIVSGNDSSAVNIVSGGSSSLLHVSSTEDFYNLSKAWAIYTDGLVENTDYSAKYYANQASSSATAASTAKNLILNNSGFIAVAAEYYCCSKCKCKCTNGYNKSK